MVVICTALIVSRPLVYSYANGNFGHSRVVDIPTAWGFCIARFYRIWRFSGATRSRAIDSAGLHAFFCVFMSVIEKHTVAVVLDRRSGNDIRIDVCVSVILSKAKNLAKY